MPLPVAPHNYQIDLTMDDRMANDLQELADKYGMTQPAVLRKAFALYVAVKSRENSEVLLRNKTTKKLTTLVGV